MSSSPKKQYHLSFAMAMDHVTMKYRLHTHWVQVEGLRLSDFVQFKLPLGTTSVSIHKYAERDALVFDHQSSHCRGDQQSEPLLVALAARSPKFSRSQKRPVEAVWRSRAEKLDVLCTTHGDALLGSPVVFLPSSRNDQSMHGASVGISVNNMHH
ncbi:predicted protein [Plenodomus lingam JN3]|uniref:Predicted protein n=1 Tax=Leptosphaeria maculans (strain JN3 / isolate v23.1.3 / race Av1-4-5-6-7-8) TaxID=985895 RepID=E4ZYY0_LEPMJ|nr:predicted protein [Plenodomus lingam JN3]CBX96415.1 predicted protein [Plenodomus lingam JN3]